MSGPAVRCRRQALAGVVSCGPRPEHGAWPWAVPSLDKGRVRVEAVRTLRGVGPAERPGTRPVLTHSGPRILEAGASALPGFPGERGVGRPRPGGPAREAQLLQSVGPACHRGSMGWCHPLTRGTRPWLAVTQPGAAEAHGWVLGPALLDSGSGGCVAWVGDPGTARTAGKGPGGGGAEVQRRGLRDTGCGKKLCCACYLGPQITAAHRPGCTAALHNRTSTPDATLPKGEASDSRRTDGICKKTTFQRKKPTRAPCPGEAVSFTPREELVLVGEAGGISPALGHRAPGQRPARLARPESPAPAISCPTPWPCGRPSGTRGRTEAVTRDSGCVLLGRAVPRGRGLAVPTGKWEPGSGGVSWLWPPGSGPCR